MAFRTLVNRITFLVTRLDTYKFKSVTPFAARWFTSIPPLQTSKRQLPPRPKLPPEDEIEESFLKGSGPGGQKINKTSSAVQLKHIPTGIVVKSQATRSRTQNRNIARELLAARLDEIYRGDLSRTSIVSALKKKKADSAAKKARRKYKALETEKQKLDTQVDKSDDSKGTTLDISLPVPEIPPPPEIRSRRIDDPDPHKP